MAPTVTRRARYVTVTRRCAKVVRSAPSQPVRERFGRDHPSAHRGRSRAARAAGHRRPRDLVGSPPRGGRESPERGRSGRAPGRRGARLPAAHPALSGKYNQVNAKVNDLTVQDGVTVDQLDVEMRGIHANFGDILNHRLGDVPVDSAVAEATVGFSAIDKVVAENMPDDNLKVEFTQATAAGSRSPAPTRTAWAAPRSRAMPRSRSRTATWCSS